MANPFAKLLGKMKGGGKTTPETDRPINVSELKELNKKLRQIKMLLIIQALEDEGSGFSYLPGADSVFSAAPTKADEGATPKAVEHERLKGNTTNRVNPKTKKQEFLLHRATTDGEYESYAMPTGSSEVRPTEYDPRSDTEWFVEFRSAEAARVAVNPVVSCWVPEDKIAKVNGLRAPAASQWGDLGKDPFAEEAKVTVRPGVYEIHSELKA